MARIGASTGPRGVADQEGGDRTVLALVSNEDRSMQRRVRVNFADSQRNKGSGFRMQVTGCCMIVASPVACGGNGVPPSTWRDARRRVRMRLWQF
jgi:hypothetical protein